MVASKPELWFNACMLKSEAIELLGGEVAAAADALGISYQAVNKWPDHLPARISDRVLGACVRKQISVPAKFYEPKQAPALTGKAQAAINSEARPQAQEVAHGY